MSVPNSCCTPCPELETVLVPGAEGDPGTDATDGTNGANAFTVTTDDFATVATSGTVTIEVADTSWMVTGQPLFIEGAGFYGVTAIVDSTHVTVENLGFTGNTGAAVNIPAGAGVSPGGEQPSLTGLAHSGVNTDITEIQGLTTPLSEDQGGTGRTAPVTPLTVYADTGGAYVITGAATKITVGATGLDLVLTTPGSWLIEAVLRFDLNAVTNGTESLVTADLYRSNNTPGNISHGEMKWNAPVPSTAQTTIGSRIPQIPPVIYKTANSDDNLQVRISKSAAIDTSGTYEIGTACIVATWLNSETA